MNVLIADDDLITLRLLENILGTVPDYKILKASDGQECWELLQGGYRPDVCLLDIEMPRLSGLDVLAKMRVHEDLKDVPVLIITGKNDVDSQASAAALRSFAFVVKPFNPKRVLSLVSEASVSTGKSFEPDGFEDRRVVLEQRGINATQYFKQMVYFVGMLGQRMEELGTSVEKGRWREVSELIGPAAKIAEFIGATPFLELFTKVEGSVTDDAIDALECAQRHFRRLRTEFDSLRTLLEARLNVVIKTGQGNRIETMPSPVAENDAAEVQLTAEIEEQESRTAQGLPGVRQRIVLKGTRSGTELLTAVLDIENGQIVLRSTIGGPIDATKKSYDIALYPENEFDKGIRITRPRPVASLAQSA